ncbi:MAG TPA: SDR family oxidoreductase [Stellaceae bacterium]|jgi:NAD(P)-dependent dehydrogenase (short-subunit alcohol dehydrogenase family)|nr:SDR family oxidoreductase [Stellaceae bacterium]
MSAPVAKPLEGKIALVTGASRGIGCAIALRLGADGALVAVHFNRDRAAAQAVVGAIAASGGTAFAIAADFNEACAAEQLFVAFDASLRQRGDKPKVDILINNAGIGGRQPIDKVAPDDFERMIAINLRAPFFVMQQALPRLVDGGRIVNISSTAARISYAETPLYAATKAALESLTLSTAKRLGQRGITVNAVAPGATRTDLNPLARDPDSAKLIASETILGRVGEPEDIADVVAFLASDQAHWITGQVIEASGGLRV